MENIKAPIISIILFFASLFIYTRLAGPIPLNISSVNTTKNESFSVSGQGKSAMKPDIAYVNAGVQAQGNSVKQSQDQINKIMNEVTRAVKEHGIDEKDIKTTNYSIQPNYDWNSGVQKITGYNANVSIRITVRDIDQLNEVIDSATKNGANNVGDISFDVENKAKAMEEARKEAVAEAKQKAEEAARIAGFRLGKIINYSESNNNFDGRLMASSYKVMEDAAVPATRIEPGTSEINLTVTLSYQID